MAEPFFGSVAPMWSANPAFGYFQTPFPFQTPTPNRPMSALAPGASLAPSAFTNALSPGIPTASALQADPYPFGSGVGLPLSGPGFGAGLSSGMWAPMATASGLPGSEILAGVTAPAFLASVAMRRGQPLGPTNDQEIEDLMGDALDLIPGASDIEVRSEGGRVMLTGTVPHKRLKRDVGEIAWAIPAIVDVQNNVAIVARRRSRAAASRDEAATTAGNARKQQAA